MKVDYLYPPSLNFRSKYVYVIGSGFNPLNGRARVVFSGAAAWKEYSCYVISTSRMYCNLRKGSGLFTAEQIGYYRIVIDGGFIVPFYYYVYDDSIRVTDFYSADKALTNASTYSVAGGRLLEVVLSGDAYLSLVVRVIFTSVGLIDGEIFKIKMRLTETRRNSNGDTVFHIKTPAWKTPVDWLSSCGKDVIPRDSCAPSLQAKMYVSLDLKSYCPPVLISFGYVRTKLLAFIYPGSTRNFGITYEINRGRVKSESEFGNIIEASNSTWNIPGGELTSDLTAFTNSSLNTSSLVALAVQRSEQEQHKALHLMKELCSRNFNLVFTSTFAYQAHTLAASWLPECRSSGTKFVNIGGLYTTRTASVGAANTYVVRYLTGMVAGADLKKRKLNHERDHGSGSYTRGCVGFIAPLPIPQVQCNINAFVIGCRRNFAGCVVKVLWTGTFIDEQVELDAAAFLYNVGQCDVITQHSSSIEPLRYFTERGGSALGYNTDARAVLGDNVLVSSLVSWSVIFDHFIRMSIADDWVPHEYFFPGLKEHAVYLSYFSPKVDAVTRQQVDWARISLRGDSRRYPFRYIFCGPLKAKYFYKQRNGNGPVINKPGEAEWVTLAEARQINPRHYITEDNKFLGANDTPGENDCLWGTSLSRPGEALKGDAYPKPFDPERVFNNYLLEGVELFDPVETDFGTIVGTGPPLSIEGYPSGDRFFQKPVVYPLCNGSQWKRTRAACNSVTMTTPIKFSFIVDAKQQKVYCGTDVDKFTGKVSTVATLPFIAASDARAPPCDYVPADSMMGVLNILLIIIGIVFMFGLYALLWIYRRERVVSNTQPALMRAMSLSGLLLCASFALFIGKPSNAICIAQIWFLNLSFDFMFSMLWAKVYRLYVVYKYARKYKTVPIRTSETMLMATNLTLLDALILIAWTLTDPPQIRARELNLDIQDGLQSITTLECRSETPSFTYMMLLYKFLLIMSNCILVYLLRKAPKELEDFIPYRFILVSAYNTAMFVGIVVFLSAVVQDVGTKHTVYTIGGVIGTMIFIGSLACPPLLKGIMR